MPFSRRLYFFLSTTHTATSLKVQQKCNECQCPLCYFLVCVLAGNFFLHIFCTRGSKICISGINGDVYSKRRKLNCFSAVLIGNQYLTCLKEQIGPGMSIRGGRPFLAVSNRKTVYVDNCSGFYLLQFFSGGVCIFSLSFSDEL